MCVTLCCFLEKRADSLDKSLTVLFIELLQNFNEVLYDCFIAIFIERICVVTEDVEGILIGADYKYGARIYRCREGVEGLEECEELKVCCLRVWPVVGEVVAWLRCSNVGS